MRYTNRRILLLYRKKFVKTNEKLVITINTTIIKLLSRKHVTALVTWTPKINSN